MVDHDIGQALLEHSVSATRKLVSTSLFSLKARVCVRRTRTLSICKNYHINAHHGNRVFV